jgi:putative FmdB family regulatory protein
MPIYEYRCDNCGKVSEVLILGASKQPRCGHCGGTNLTKLVSAPNPVIKSDSGSGSFPSGSCCGSSGSCGTPGGCCS